MTDLVYVKTDEAMTDSLTVAESFGKEHAKVMRSIDILVETLAKNGERSPLFIQTRRKAADGQYHRLYLMNRDGFSLLVMGFTGKKALNWKLKYIDAFNRMESVVTQRRTADWLQTRRRGQLVRKEETDTIQKLVDYAREQGSTHSDKLYMVYSRLANKYAGIETRDTATVEQLNMLSIYERIALNMMHAGMKAGKHYKAIYQDTKQRFIEVQQMAYLA